MFRCELGNHQSFPGEKMVRVVVEKRPHVYPYKGGVGQGWEIVREVAACFDHARTYGTNPEPVAEMSHG